MKYYIINRTVGYGSIGTSRIEVPDIAVCRLPDGEKVEWLDIVNDISSGAEFSKKAVVNETKKAAYLALVETRAAERVIQDTKRKTRMTKLKTAYNNMDTIIADPVKLKKLLKQILITIAGLSEE